MTTVGCRGNPEEEVATGAMQVGADPSEEVALRCNLKSGQDWEKPSQQRE